MKQLFSIVASLSVLMGGVSRSWAEEETATVTFDLYAEFEGPVNVSQGIPTGGITFNYPEGSWVTQVGDWSGGQSPPYIKEATETVSCEVTEGMPVMFSCSYDSDTLDYSLGGCLIRRVKPPAWATRVVMNEGIDPDPIVWTKTQDNVWLSEDLSAWNIYAGYYDLSEYTKFPFDTGGSVITVTFHGETSCNACRSCQASAGSPGGLTPSVGKGSGGVPSISAPLGLGNDCCSDKSKPNYARWNPASLADAVAPSSIKLSSYDLLTGLASRYPAAASSPLQQLKIGGSLGVAVAGTNTLVWRIYDATGIGAPDGAGQYPLTKTDNTPLPLLNEVTITQENADSVLYEYRLGGALVNQSRITHDATQNFWQNENIPAGSRDKLTIAGSGTGWLSTSERFKENSSGVWKIVSADSSTTATVNGMEVVVQETQGGETVATHGYDSTGRRKWTVNGDGSWKFFEYDTATEYSVYSPYGDTAFPGSAWIPSLSAMTGIRCDSHIDTGSTSLIESVVVGSHSQSISSAGNYDSTTETYGTQGTTRTTSINESEYVFKGFRGKVLLELDGHGVTTLHEYTRGTVDTNGFIPAENGADVMEIITTGDSAGDIPELQFYDSDYLILHPAIVGAKFPDFVTREVRVYDSKGRTVCTATQVLDGSDYAVATQTVRSYTSLPNNAGEVITEAKDGSVVSVSSSLSDGTWDENVDEAGAVITTVRDLLGRVVTETLPGDGGTITRTYAYDGLTTTITTSGGGLSLATSETRDLRGRVLSSIDETGIVTGYSYTDGVRTSTSTRPGGITEITTNYLDGRFKQRSGSGVIREFASYEIDASGNEMTKRSNGPAVSGDHGVRWTETTTNTQGRTVSTRRPGPPDETGGRQANVTESYNYNPTTGKLASVTSSARTGIYQLSEEDLLGTWSATGIATHTGPLVAASSDRFSTNTRTYEKRGNYFWEITTRSTYVQGFTPVTTSTAVRLWVGDGEVSETTDAANITTTRTTAYDPAHQTVVTSSGNSLQGTTTATTINGFLKTRSILGAAQDETFGYDGLGREIRRTDVRNASTHTIYNNLGQVEKIVDHLGQSVTYTYYPANHQSAGRVHTQTDAAGKVTETGYDALGRVSSTGGNAAYPLSYTYDDFGDRETLISYGTQTAITTWVNDPPTGLLLEKKYHGQTNGVKYTYFGDGRMASRTWRRGIRTDYGYNSFGDMDSIFYPDSTPDVSLSNFDRLGRPGTVTEGGNSTTLAYDTLTGETSTTYSATHGILPNLSVVAKSPNSGRPGGYTLSQGSTALEDVAYGYDTSGRLGGLTSGGHEIGYQYYPGTGVLRETTHTVTGGGTPRIEIRAVDLAGRTTGVVTTVPSATGRRIAASAGYMLNDRGLREKFTREDGTSWSYGYNDRSEVTTGNKKLANGQRASGLQFGYQYDAIGNREWAKSGGDSSGNNQRTVNYTPNAMNQYSSITTPNSFDVLVRSPQSLGVAVNGSSAAVSAQGDFCRAEATATNTNGAWVGLDITSPPGAAPHFIGHRWLPPASFNPSHDDDGNLLDDGRWTNTWDAENRLVTQTTTALAAGAGIPRCKVENTYDWQSRRIQKKVSTSTNGTTWTLSGDERFVYDGWNQLALFNASGSTLTVKETNLWGIDLSGTRQGAGGVSGLLAVNTVSPQSVCYPAYDGNGNIIAWTATNGDTLQRIDYDPFGNVVLRDGVSGFEAPAWGFSTKYQDKETGVIYYGFRFYDPVSGRWISRDPIEEAGGTNIYTILDNDPINKSDYLGLRIALSPENLRIMKILRKAQAGVRESPFEAHTNLASAIDKVADVFKKNWMLIDTYVNTSVGSSYYNWATNNYVLRSENETPAIIVHESVHMYNDFTNPGLWNKMSAGTDEGMAYAMESIFRTIYDFRSSFDPFLSRGGSTSRGNYSCEQLKHVAGNRWRGLWDEMHMGGSRVYDDTEDKPLTNGDFQLLNRKLGATLSCREIARILNSSEVAKRCCIKFSCEDGADEAVGEDIIIKTRTKIHDAVR